MKKENMYNLEYVCSRRVVLNKEELNTFFKGSDIDEISRHINIHGEGILYARNIYEGLVIDEFILPNREDIIDILKRDESTKYNIIYKSGRVLQNGYMEALSSITLFGNKVGEKLDTLIICKLNEVLVQYFSVDIIGEDKFFICFDIYRMPYTKKIDDDIINRIRIKKDNK